MRTLPLDIPVCSSQLESQGTTPPWAPLAYECQLFAIRKQKSTYIFHRLDKKNTKPDETGSQVRRPSLHIMPPTLSKVI
jgi:hypothetical protein